MSKIVDRRNFLKLAGITTAATAASLSLTGCGSNGKAATETEVGGGINFSKEVDVLIVGSGAAGLWCAYETLAAGLSTCILEKEIAHGGDSLLACACLPIIGTKPLLESGLLPMTAEEAYEKYYDVLFSKRRVPELGKHILVNAARCVDIWTEKFGIEWMPFIPGPTSYFHVPVPGLGTDYLLINPLFDDVVKSGADVMFETKAVNYIVDENNEVVGMRALDLRSQSYVDIKAKVVVMTSGDFVSNQEMVAKNLPGWGRMVCNTYTSMGQGIQMSETIGATLERMDDPCNFTAENPNIVVWGFYDPVLQVLPNGKRFCNESLGHEVAGACYEAGK